SRIFPTTVRKPSSPRQRPQSLQRSVGNAGKRPPTRPIAMQDISQRLQQSTGDENVWQWLDPAGGEQLEAIRAGGRQRFDDRREHLLAPGRQCQPTEGRLFLFNARPL